MFVTITVSCGNKLLKVNLLNKFSCYELKQLRFRVGVSPANFIRLPKPL